MLVIDIGCATYGGDASIPYLVEEFQPNTLIGFDPACEPAEYMIGDTYVEVRQQAAWLYNGMIGFAVGGLGGHVDLDRKNAKQYRCVDLAAFILDNRTIHETVILKLDCEGAEYQLLPHLVDQGADRVLKMCICEAHCEWCGIGGNGRHREGCEVDPDWWFERWEKVSGAMRCEMREWNR